jgi:hypothetical protein
MKKKKTHYQVQEILINIICSSGVKSTRIFSFVFSLMSLIDTFGFIFPCPSVIVTR